MPPIPVPTADRFNGFLIGMAVGDAIGLPREGIGRRRAAKMFGDAPLNQGLIFGRGMVSDDTEHMRMTAVSLLQDPSDSNRFARTLGWKLRWWLLALPAGTGMATARAIIRLWFGWPPDRSGVFSAGNGPAMRAGIIGLCLHRDDDPLPAFVRASTRITHVDPRAEFGALLIAMAVREAMRAEGPINPTNFLTRCHQVCTIGEWHAALGIVERALASEDSATQFAARLGCEQGISGYIVHTVTAVLFCWLRWPGEFRQPLEQIIILGGDSDTTGAILGGLAGASCGAKAIPPEWTDRMMEWPYSVTWLRSVLSQELQRRFADPRLAASEGHRVRPPLPQPLNGLMVLVRNIAFLAVVLGHGLRRLLPPY